MKIIFWNIRAGGGKRATKIAAQLQQWQPDIVALAEFRGTPASTELARQLAENGFHHQLSTIDTQKRATNALLLASRYPLQQFDLLGAPAEPQRWLMAQVQYPKFSTESFMLGVMHVPNYVTKRKFPYHDAVLSLLQEWTLGPAFLVGDTNTGISYLDDVTGVFTKREMAWMTALDELAWRDAHRYLYGDERVYTWYSPNAGNGFRLDQAFFNPQLLPYLQNIEHQWGIDPENSARRDGLSDHAALVMTLDESQRIV